MLGRMYDGEVCSAARTLEVVGERWSLLIVRNAMFAGLTRFTEFQRSLGIAPNVLAKRLADFVAAGVFEQRPDGAGGSEYRLTEKGRELQPVILALTAWGDRWAPDERGLPVVYEHKGCGGHVAMHAECERCGLHPAPERVEANVAGWVERYTA